MRGRAGLLVAVLVAGAAVALAQESELDGLPIVRIVIVRHNMFDTDNPATSAWPYRWADAIHIVTREGFIRRMLLFKEGDPYLERLAAESARNLRAREFLNPVDITARRVEGGVEVTVSTRDGWTLEAGAQAGLAGKRSSHSFEITEINLMGWGREVSVKSSSTNERNKWTYSLFDPDILASHWQARLLHEESSDGSRDLVHVEYPFYQLDTPRSCGVEWSRGSLVDHLYSQSDTQVQGTHTVDGWQLWGGLRLPGDGSVTHRLSVGWQTRTDTFSDWTGAVPYPTPESREISGPTVAYERVTNRFLVVSGFRAWTKQEDFGLGPNYDLGLTLSLPAFGGDEPRVLLNGSLHTATERGRWLVYGDGSLSGRFDQGHPRNWVVGLQAAAAQLGPRGFQARLKVEASHELDLESQLTLGADTGLRGWGPDHFDGTGRAVANLQWRTLLKDDIVHFFSLGMVVFADAGATWGARVGPGTGRGHGDVGVGLLADLTHLGLARLLRLDLGFADDGSGYTLTVSTTPLF